MKKTILSIVFILSITALLTGCATQKTVDLATVTAGAYSNYLEQAKVAPLIALHAPTGQTVSVTITGAQEIVLNAQVPALSLMPKDRDGIASFMNGAARIAGIASAGIVGYRGVGALSEIATSPTIVTQPEPLIVNPVIVGAP